MSHTERESVPDGGTNERQGVLSLKFLASVWNTKYAIISKGVDSVFGMYRSGRSDMEGGAVQVITLWQIVAILYSILCSTGNQCKSTIRLWKEHSIAAHTLMFSYTLLFLQHVSVPSKKRFCLDLTDLVSYKRNMASYNLSGLCGCVITAI